MAPTKDQRSVDVELVCLDTPTSDEPMLFGLQDKKKAVDEGTPLLTGGTLYACTLVAKPATGGGIRWSGPFVHGSKEQYLYLSLATVAAPTTWVRRYKVMLDGITWDAINHADDPYACIRGTIAELKGTRPAFVEDGWIVAVNEDTV